MDEPDMKGNQIVTDPPATWASKSFPYVQNDPSSSYTTYLPPVLEEPSSSLSEAADADPLSAMEGHEISGEAYPGHEFQASRYSIHGTTGCNFEWVQMILDTYLAIEVQSMDDRKRKGELVKVFANEHMKITCEPKMQNVIKKTLYIVHGSYLVSLLVDDGCLSWWMILTCGSQLL